MILPDKSTPLSNSILGKGYLILDELETGQTVSSLWEKVKAKQEIRTFENFLLTMDFLFSIGLIRIEQGIVMREKL
jgi:hypothetical protein